MDLTDANVEDVMELSALRPLRDPLRLLVAIDDAAEYPLPAHLVVNAAPGVRPGNGGGENYLLGTSFALLNPEFAALPARDWVRAPARVFVTLDAEAPPGLMGTLVTATRRALPRAAIDVVIGPAADQLLVTRALQPIRDVTVHAASSDIRALMLAADLAVTAGGGTVFELAATGMPMVGVALAANQRPNLIGLSEAQALIFAGAAEDIGLAATVEDTLQTLALDANRRRALGARARRLVDGRGAARVAEAMRARLAGTPWPARAAT
jgi:spore coat polysaccharide biosynthesis predicted glycosyltransferase SpsG